MKFLALGLMLVGAVQAGTLVQLAQPPSLNGVGGAQHSCVGVGFNADHSIYGACRTVTSSACSGRGCQPVTVTTDYATVWDAAGDPIVAVLCSITRHHIPQTNTTQYAPGYDATNCPSVVLGTGTTVGIPYGPYAWQEAYYYYVTTDPVTGAELVNSNSWGFLFTP